MISPLDAAGLVVAGVVAGLVGSAGGITSLVSYPALLAVGLPAHAASVANNMAIVACWPGSAAASRPELRGHGLWVRVWAAVAAAGGAAGAALLLLTPPGAFARIVPFLVAAGSVTLLAQPRLSAAHRRRDGALHPAVLPAGVVVLALYNGYFGAGAGVMTLTLVLVLVDARLPTANALKNMLIGAGSLACAAVLVVAGTVAWAATAPLAVGMLAGSTLGPRVARSIPAPVLRVVVAVLGLVLAVDLWIDPAG